VADINARPLSDLALRIHETSAEHGFWPDGDRNMGEAIALAHSELSEALEEHRSGHPAVWMKHTNDCAKAVVAGRGQEVAATACTCTPKPEGIAIELIDCMVRCLDLLHSLGVNVDNLMELKVAYNESRPHKHGRQY
jgi:hypothetical protein